MGYPDAREGTWDASVFASPRRPAPRCGFPLKRKGTVEVSRLKEAGMRIEGQERRLSQEVFRRNRAHAETRCPYSGPDKVDHSATHRRHRGDSHLHAPMRS